MQATQAVSTYQNEVEVGIQSRTRKTELYRLGFRCGENRVMSDSKDVLCRVMEVRVAYGIGGSAKGPTVCHSSLPHRKRERERDHGSSMSSSLSIPGMSGMCRMEPPLAVGEVDIKLMLKWEG